MPSPWREQIAPDVERTAALTGLREEDVARFFAWFADTEKVVTCYSQGVNQSVQGTDKVNAIINCHLATRRIGRPGMGPLSLTGQPNAMGGREVGGLANQLAAHMGFDHAAVDRVGRFWKAPSTARREGLKAVDLFQAVEDGEIKALWIMATNPVVSLPRAEAVRRALGNLELLVVSDNVLGADTVSLAKVRLPACGWGEKDGTVTNSERRISRQRAFLPPPGEAKPDWWIVTQVARRMGFADAFPYQSPAEIFAEHAALSAFENDGGRDFDFGGLATLGRARVRSNAAGPMAARRGQRAGEPAAVSRTAASLPPIAERASFPLVRRRSWRTSAFPLRLNTGRIRDQWHTMTRTGKSPRLSRHIAEPYIEVHPDDAERSGLADGGWAEVKTAHGACVLRVRVSDAQQPGTLFAPIHWSAENSSHGRIGMLVHARTDAISGQPDSKATPASVAPVSYRYRGFLLSRAPLPLTCEYWVRIAQEGGWLYLIAMDDVPGASWRAWFLSLVDAADGDLLELSDRQGANYRAALVHGQRLTAAAVLTEADELPASGWLAALLARIRHRCRHPARASGRQDARHRSGLRADRLRLFRRRPQPDRRGDHRREACLRRGHRPPPESRDQLRLVCSRTTAHPRRCDCRSRLKRVAPAKTSQSRAYRIGGVFGAEPPGISQNPDHPQHVLMRLSQWVISGRSRRSTRLQLRPQCRAQSPYDVRTVGCCVGRPKALMLNRNPRYDLRRRSR